MVNYCRKNPRYPKIYFNFWFMLIMLSRKPGSGGHIGSQSCLFSSFRSGGCHREATTKGWHSISTPTYKPRAFWIPCAVIYVHNRTYIIIYIYIHMYLIIYTYYIINGKVPSLYARCLTFVQCESTCCPHFRRRLWPKGRPWWQWLSRLSGSAKIWIRNCPMDEISIINNIINDISI